MSTIFENQETKLIMEHMYFVERQHTISIAVESKGFKGICEYCISTDELQKVKEALKKSGNTLKGTIELKDYDSDAYMKFDFNTLGKLDVSGQIGASYNDHFMKFKFQADQTLITAINLFISEFLIYEG